MITYINNKKDLKKVSCPLESLFIFKEKKLIVSKMIIDCFELFQGEIIGRSFPKDLLQNEYITQNKTDGTKESIEACVTNFLRRQFQNSFVIFYECNFLEEHLPILLDCQNGVFLINCTLNNKSIETLSEDYNIFVFDNVIDREKINNF